MLRLYTFNISHFSEKARWALDFAGVRYQEKTLLPGPHLLVVTRLAPKTSVPVLDHDGHIVQGSSAIVDYVAGQLGGNKLAPVQNRGADSADGMSLEALADRAFGRGIQSIFYEALLRDRSTLIDLWSADGPRWARAFYSVGFAGVAAGVRRMYKVAPETTVRAKIRFREAFDATDRVLAQRPFLDGEGPGRTDITVAALLAPMCRPLEHRVRWPELGGDLAPFAAEFDGRPTWQHVLKMYRDHRCAA